MFALDAQIQLFLNNFNFNFAFNLIIFNVYLFFSIMNKLCDHEMVKMSKTRKYLGDCARDYNT